MKKKSEAKQMQIWHKTRGIMIMVYHHYYFPQRFSERFQSERKIALSSAFHLFFRTKYGQNI